MLDNDFTLDYDACRRLLLERLQEPAPGRIQLLTGPRQVGKTTLLLDLTKHLGETAQYVAGDDPQAGLPGFWERVWAEAEARARRSPAVLFLDEIQPKLITLNNALLSAMHPQGPPDEEREPVRFGAWVENACLAFAWNAGQRVMYWREEPLEVDGVIEGNWGAWAIEVKTGAFESTHLRGLLEFCRRYPRYRPLVVTAVGNESLATRFGLAAVNWPEFLLSGLPGRGQDRG